MFPLAPPFILPLATIWNQDCRRFLVDSFLADEAHTEQGNFNKRRRVFYLKAELDAHRPFSPGLQLTQQALPFLSPAWRAANIAKGHRMLPVQIHPGLTWIWSTLLLPWPRDIIKPTFTTLRAAYWDWIITGGTKAFESNTTNLILYVNKLSCQTTPKKPGLTDLNCLLYVFSKLCSVTDFDLL